MTFEIWFIDSKNKVLIFKLNRNKYKSYMLITKIYYNSWVFARISFKEYNGQVTKSSRSNITNISLDITN